MRIRCHASVQDLTLSISSIVYRPSSSLSSSFRIDFLLCIKMHCHHFTVLCRSVVPGLFYKTLQHYLLSLDVVWCTSFVVISSIMVILVASSCCSVVSSLMVVFFCHIVEFSIEAIWSCLVHGNLLSQSVSRVVSSVSFLNCVVNSRLQKSVLLRYSRNTKSVVVSTLVPLVAKVASEIPRIWILKRWSCSRGGRV